MTTSNKLPIRGFLRTKEGNPNTAVERASRMGCVVLYARQENGANFVGVELPDWRAVEGITRAVLFEGTLFESERQC